MLKATAVVEAIVLTRTTMTRTEPRGFLWWAGGAATCWTRAGGLGRGVGAGVGAGDGAGGGAGAGTGTGTAA
ncbi:hypothetical protein [Nonomuraea sp. NPDC050783]|uniref:hypothetical protein n=1 Tax=Nonomuraea sp. NPDC050783 TaxID=3154634 RepID=UPI003467B14C